MRAHRTTTERATEGGQRTERTESSEQKAEGRGRDSEMERKNKVECFETIDGASWKKIIIGDMRACNEYKMQLM